jgi:hypothetical protein
MHPVTSGEPPAEPVRTLYHGTLKSLVPAILRDGLWPGVGVFTRSMYAELEEAGGELPDLVFASDRHGVRACYSAILDGIRRCGVRRPDATDFAEMGAILIIRKAAGRFVQRPPDDDGGWHDHPETSEPGDFYTDSEVPVDGVISGRRVLRFLHRHGVDLSRLGPEAVDLCRGDLVRSAAREMPDRLGDALARVRALSDLDVMRLWHAERAMTDGHRLSRLLQPPTQTCRPAGFGA